MTYLIQFLQLCWDIAWSIVEVVVLGRKDVGPR
jgi:hypothetical protein